LFDLLTCGAIVTECPTELDLPITICYPAPVSLPSCARRLGQDDEQLSIESTPDIPIHHYSWLERCCEATIQAC
jgi:hypothetical protein